VNLLPFALALGAGACLAAAGGCANLPSGSVPAGSPAPTATAAATQGACVQTPAANAQIVVISPLITPVVDPVYGIISGYGLVASGNSSNVAAPIVVAPAATLQFFDNDELGTQLRYSAVGIPGVKAFPSPGFTFPPSSTAQSGTQINATSAWSTGLLSGQCYSQTFTIAAPGTYFFGDDNYYSLGNLRDVIVATSSP
jgi:hypothetical protein